MENERIERQYQDAKELYAYLIKHDEVSFASYIDGVYKKVLLLSAASFFEYMITSHIKKFTQKASKSDMRLVTLVEKKVLVRQYHTLFDWNSNNTNKFWGLFGDETRKKARELIDNDDNLTQAEKAFLDLGKSRNSLVHENFSEYDINTTLQEIYDKYKSACKFIDFAVGVLDKDFIKRISDSRKSDIG